MKVHRISIMRLAQLVAIISCCVMFHFLMWDVWEKFNRGATTSGLMFTDEGEKSKLLPCITVCKRKGFRMRGMRSTEEEFLKQTFNMNEIIADDQPILGFNLCQPNVTEVRSIYLGRCYTVCFNKKVTVNDSCFIPVRKHDELMLFIHDPEDQQYIVTALVTNQLAFVDVNPDAGTAGMFINLLKRREVSLNRENNPCKIYKGGRTEYNQCVQDSVWSLMKDIMTCIYPGTEMYFPKNVTLPHCNNDTIAQSIFDRFINITFLDQQLNCITPCTWSTYKFSLKITHINSWTNTNGLFPDSVFENSASTSFKFVSLLVEEDVESYVYDYGNFMVALGGNLGLMLGFSCLSVAFASIQFIFKKVV